MSSSGLPPTSSTNRSSRGTSMISNASVLTSRHTEQLHLVELVDDGQSKRPSVWYEAIDIDLPLVTPDVGSVSPQCNYTVFPQLCIRAIRCVTALLGSRPVASDSAYLALSVGGRRLVRVPPRDRRDSLPLGVAVTPPVEYHARNVGRLASGRSSSKSAYWLDHRFYRHRILISGCPRL